VTGAGTSVALSRDGSVALVGAPFADGGKGAAYLFARSRSLWARRQKLTVAAAGIGATGSSVALSANGAVALLGSPYEEGQAGAAHLFVRTRLRWQLRQKLSVAGVAVGAAGLSVALSGDGAIALLGAPNDDNGHGAAYVFARSRTGWAQQQRLVPAGPSGTRQSAWSVALSTAGSTALLGAPNDDSRTGAAYVVATRPPPGRFR
jgi:hypothetical protein